MNKALKTDADRLADQAFVCAVASMTDDEYPRVCCLTPLKNQGIHEFWFSTGTSSAKTRQFLRNQKASVLIHDDRDSVTLLGTMEIVNDRTVKDSLWRDSLTKHFPNGGKEDPEYCILHFKSSEATVCIGDHFLTVRL